MTRKKKIRRKTSPNRRRLRLATITTFFLFGRYIYSSDIFETQKKNVVSEYYDTSDPFIDDSELAIDERQFFAQTKQQGFYVSSGEVALLKDKYVFLLLLHHTPDLSSTFLHARIELPRNLNQRKFHLHPVFKNLYTQKRNNIHNNNKYLKERKKHLSLSMLLSTQMRNGSKWRIHLSY